MKKRSGERLIILGAMTVTVVLLLALASCGGGQQIDKVSGSWLVSYNWGGPSTGTFTANLATDGSFTATNDSNLPDAVFTGSWSLNDGTITIDYDPYEGDEALYIGTLSDDLSSINGTMTMDSSSGSQLSGTWTAARNE